MSYSSMQLMLRELRRQNRKHGIVERFVHNRKPGGIRSDLFGIFDLIALGPGRQIVGIQTCKEDFSAHYRKITELNVDNAVDWMICGGKIELWDWRKLKVKRGGKATRWYPRVKYIGWDDLKGKYEPQAMP